MRWLEASVQYSFFVDWNKILMFLLMSLNFKDQWSLPSSATEPVAISWDKYKFASQARLIFCMSQRLL